MTPMPSIPPAAASALAYRRWLMHDDAASMMTTPASMTAADMRARPRLTPCLAAWTAYLTFVQKVSKEALCASSWQQPADMYIVLNAGQPADMCFILRLRSSSTPAAY